MRDCNVEADRPQMTIWRISIACWILKAISTRSEYEIHIAFPLQQWLHERASMLRYSAFACLVFVSPKAVRNAGILFHTVWAVCIVLLGEPLVLLLSHINCQTLIRKFAYCTSLNLMIRKCHGSVLFFSHFS